MLIMSERDTDEKKFDLVKQWSGNDMSTFTGRLKHFWEIVSPENCFYSNATITDYQRKVDRLI